MNFKVIDEHGRQLDMGRNLPTLQAEFGGQARESFQKIAAADAKVAEGLHERITDWDFGELPELLEIRRGGQTLVGHPALVDRGEYCSLEVFDDADEARERHREGLQRLFRLQLRDQIKFLEKSLGNLQTTQMQAATVPALAAAVPGFEALREQIVAAAIERVCLAEPWPTDTASFGARRQDARGKLSLIAQEVARLVQTIVAEAAAVTKKLPGVRSREQRSPTSSSSCSGCSASAFWSRRRRHSSCTIRDISRRWPRGLTGSRPIRARYGADGRDRAVPDTLAARSGGAQGRRGPTARGVPLAARGVARVAVRAGATHTRAGSAKRLQKVWDSLRR